MWLQHLIHALSSDVGKLVMITKKIPELNAELVNVKVRTPVRVASSYHVASYISMHGLYIRISYIAVDL